MNVLVERARENGACLNPDDCEEQDCYCKIDVTRLLRDNEAFTEEIRALTDDKNDLVGILHERDEQIAELQSGFTRLQDDLANL